MSTVGTGPWPPSTATFFDETAALMLAGDPRVQLLGPISDAPEHLGRRAAQVTDSVWTMQTTVGLRTMCAQLRAVRLHPTGPPDSRYVAPLTALQACPLLPSVHPNVRVRSVPGAVLITDEEHAFLAGPPGTRLAETIWATTDPGLVTRACQVFRTLWDTARPASEVSTRPVLPPRRAEVAMLLADGASDLEIAQALGISPRTASAEVRQVIDWCGARGRGHAIAVIVGADR